MVPSRVTGGDSWASLKKGGDREDVRTKGLTMVYWRVSRKEEHTRNGGKIDVRTKRMTRSPEGPAGAVFSGVRGGRLLNVVRSRNAAQKNEKSR